MTQGWEPSAEDLDAMVNQLQDELDSDRYSSSADAWIGAAKLAYHIAAERQPTTEMTLGEFTRLWSSRILEENTTLRRENARLRAALELARPLLDRIAAALNSQEEPQK